MPLIKQGQDLDRLLQNEVEYEEQKEPPDYQKLQVLESFKKAKADYIRRHTKKKSDDPAEELKIYKEVEEAYLK